jgi:biopolymer transport protein TolR
MAFSSSQEDHGSPLSDINITPLVDVMLVLLVIFMVTTPMMESGIPIDLPKASGKALPKTEKTVTLSLTKETRFFLDKDEVPYSQLRDKLIQYYRSRQKKEIFIRADGVLPYAVVAKTMALVKAAGINRIGLVTNPAIEQSGKSNKK